MTRPTDFDYARPYDLMVGLWAGMATSYDAQGNYLLSVPSLVAIYWERPGTVLHYRQDEMADLDERLEGHPHASALAKIIHHNFNLKITGKSCISTEASHKDVRVAGTETRPGVYLFHLMFEEGHYYNNQYFTDPNERQIIGPFVAAAGEQPVGRRAASPPAPVGMITVVVAQTFTRIAYDVPERFKRAIRKAR
jgi:hypothetical protein